MNYYSVIFAALIVCLEINYSTSQTLAGYGGDVNSVSVSGISSGAAFAIQFHVAYSSQVIGVGAVAGVVFYCAGATLTGATLCMETPAIINVDYFVQVTRTTAATGFLDDVSGMSGDKVYIFDGTLDTVVLPENGPKIQEYYQNFGADIATEFNLDAEHCMPTVDYGNTCSQLGSPFLSKCDYNAAYILLNHIYGGLQEPTGTVALNGELLTFDQSEFISGSPGSISMDSTGYIYVPSGCVSNSGCKVHLAFHGCEQGRAYIDDTYVTNSGYNEVAEINNIIIVYPQVVNSNALPSNPNGCWDWWGYTTVDYASNIGPQMVAVHNILERVLS